jgi:hypothetical protein
VAIPAASALAVASLAVQGFANVETLGGPRPLSVYALTIARSGERKTACDAPFMAALREHEREQACAHRAAHASWLNAQALRKGERERILAEAKKAKGKDRVASQADLDALGAETGIDLTRRKEERWVIDFGNELTEQEAAFFEAPFQHALATVRPNRLRLNEDGSFAVRRENHRKYWWRYGEARPGMRSKLAPLTRYIATPEVAKHRFFSFLETTVVPTGSIYAIAREDDTTFGILHSSFHELWALRMGTSLEDRPRYTPSTTFETFPFPKGLTPNTPAADYAEDPRAIKIAAAAQHLNKLRENWLNPADLVDRVPEVVPGYPDRILPKDDAAAKELKKRTLTNLYNARPAWLDHAHKALDEAVAEAYGWGDDWRAGVLTEDEILARLFKLNQERAKKG